LHDEGKRSGGMALIGVAFASASRSGRLIAWAGVSLFPEHRAAGLPGGGAIVPRAALRLCQTAGNPRPRRCRVRTGLAQHSRFDGHVKMPTIGALVLIFFLATFAFACFETTLSLLSQRGLNYDDRANYLLFAYIGFTFDAGPGVLLPQAGQDVGRGETAENRRGPDADRHGDADGDGQPDGAGDSVSRGDSWRGS